MIAAVSGRVMSKSGDQVVVQTAAGVSYELAVPLGVLERLPVEGAPVTLKTVLVVREDAWALYGFDDEVERSVFQKLLAATGVGPRLALAIVSTLGGIRVARSIANGDLAALCTVPGVGKKKAERLVLELKDRLGDLAVPGAEAAVHAPAEQAVRALVNLGYTHPDAERAVRSLVSEDGAAQPIDLIRGALKLLQATK